MERERKIYVFADFLSFNEELIGTIYVSQTRGKEFYSFEYEQSWIEKGLRYWIRICSYIKEDNI